MSYGTFGQLDLEEVFTAIDDSPSTMTTGLPWKRCMRSSTSTFES